MLCAFAVAAYIQSRLLCLNMNVNFKEWEYYYVKILITYNIKKTPLNCWIVVLCHSGTMTAYRPLEYKGLQMNWSGAAYLTWVHQTHSQKRWNKCPHLPWVTLSSHSALSLSILLLISPSFLPPFPHTHDPHSHYRQWAHFLFPTLRLLQNAICIWLIPSISFALTTRFPPRIIIKITRSSLQL